MAHHLSAVKRIRTSQKANLRNRQARATLRGALRRFREGFNGGQGNDLLRSAISTIDHLVSKGLLHRNTAARRKSKLVRQLTKADSQPEAPARS